jgi:hypothetical protein
MKKLVAYVRSGSGLKVTAQRRDVENFCRENDYESAGEDLELATAIEHARSLPALLLIPRLYPLSRDPDVIAALLAGGVDFRAVDLPDANRTWLRAHKPVAEQEAEAHSQLIKVALATAPPKKDDAKREDVKRRGFPAAALQKSVETRRALRDRMMVAVAGKIVTLRARGLNFGAIAHELNDDGHRTVTKKPWRARSVEHVAKRIGGATRVPFRRRSWRELRRLHVS